MNTTLDALDELNLERRRVQFTFYGWKRPTGELGGPYLKQAHSFAEAYWDLLANPAVRHAAYVVNDIFVEDDGEDGPTLHVELRDLVAELEQTGGDDNG